MKTCKTLSIMDYSAWIVLVLNILGAYYKPYSLLVYNSIYSKLKCINTYFNKKFLNIYLHACFRS